MQYAVMAGFDDPETVPDFRRVCALEIGMYGSLAEALSVAYSLRDVPADRIFRSNPLADVYDVIEAPALPIVGTSIEFFDGEMTVETIDVY